METCVLQQSLQVITTTTTANGQGTELGSNRLTIQHQDNASTTDTNTSTDIINNRKSSSASLSDLIPAAAAALRTRQQLQRSQWQSGDNNKGDPLLSTKTTLQDSTFYSQQQQQSTTNSTPFARALTKVKLQVQTKRLKERYLSHEWIRLALSLPVDLSRINLHHCYYAREQAEDGGKQRKSTQTDEKADTMTLAPTPNLSLICSPPSPAPSDTTASSNLLLKNDNKHQQQDNQMEVQPDGRSIPASTSATTTPPASPSSSRTGEIATWYEWKFDRNKFSVEEVQCKVDRLRTTKMTTKIRDKLVSSP